MVEPLLDTGIVAYSENWHFSYNAEWDEWALPGQGEALADCGQFGYRGCIHDHIVQKYKRSCNRPSCPTCYEGWASLEAHKIVSGLSKNHGRWRNPCHFSFNPAPCLWLWPPEKLIAYVYKIARRMGIEGGTLLVHPRRKNGAGKWYISPHVHVFGYGWLREYYIRGWVVKNHGVRRSEKERYTTARYQLSHAGVHSLKHTVRWFGVLRKGRAKYVPPKHLCPVCGMELKPLIWIGQGDTPPPLESYVWHDGDWQYVASDWMEKLRGRIEDDHPRLPSVDYRFCLVKPSKIVSKPVVAHTLEALKVANPLTPEWFLKLFLEG